MSAFPRMMYQVDGTTVVVHNEAELAALSGGWFDTPADFGLVTAPSVEQMAQGTPATSDVAPHGRVIVADENTVERPSHGRGHGRGGSHGG